MENKVNEAAKIQELEKSAAAFKEEVVKKISSIQKERLSYITSIMLNYKPLQMEHFSEVEQLYEIELAKLSSEAIVYEENPAIFNIFVEHLTYIVSQREQLVREMIDENEKDIDRFQSHILAYSKESSEYLSALITSIFGYTSTKLNDDEVIEIQDLLSDLC